MLAAADDSGDVGDAAARRRARSALAPDAARRRRARGPARRVEGDRLRFRHPLRALGGLPRQPASPSAARRTGRWPPCSTTTADADRRAWHRAAAATAPDDEAAAALARTADHAADRGGHAAAARALERAAELDSDAQRRTAHLVAAATSSALAGRAGHAIALLDRAEPLLNDPLSRAAAAKVRGEVSLAVGRPSDAHDLLADAAWAVMPSDRATALRLLMRACMAAALAGEPQAIARILAALDRNPQGDPTFSSQLLAGIGRLISGDTSGVASIEAALAQADALDEPHLVQQAGGGAIFLGDWARARRFFERAIALSRDQGVVALLPDLLGLRALLTMWDRRLAEAAADADEAVRLARDIGAGNAVALPVCVLAWIEGLRGDEEACRSHVDDVLAMALERGLALPAGLATWALAQLDLAAGRWDEALLRLVAVAEVRPGFGHPFLPVLSAWDRIEAAVHAGRDDVAEQALALFAAWAQSAAPAWAAPVLADCRALVAPPAEADPHFEAAVAGLEAVSPLDQARIHLHYGEHLRRERRKIDARAHLRAAYEGFDWLGAAPWAERAHRELRATGERARKRHLSPLAELTPQEIQVARLVGEGATNKDVASQLFVSPQDRRVPPAQGVRQARDLLADGARRARARAGGPGARLTGGGRPCGPRGPQGPWAETRHVTDSSGCGLRTLAACSQNSTSPPWKTTSSSSSEPPATSRGASCCPGSSASTRPGSCPSAIASSGPPACGSTATASAH